MSDFTIVLERCEGSVMLKEVSMRVAVLGSGSGGNATVISCAEGTFLIDAGLSAKQLVVRLEALGIDADTLTGIFLTHEHSDHARGLDVFLRKRNIPVYANAMTKEALEWGIKSSVSWKVFQTGQVFKVGTMEVLGFSIPHDAAEPVGYSIEVGGVKFGLVTDVGCTTQGMRVNLKESHALFVEANYDEGLLEMDTKRPWATKQRIASRHGHLSNTQAGELIAEVGCEKLQHVFLGHLSGDCNRAEKAEKTVGDLLDNVSISAEVICASQDQPTVWAEVKGEQASSNVELMKVIEADTFVQNDLL